MDERQRDYLQELGFNPFPLAANSKVPPKGARLDTIDTAYPWPQRSNTGLFAGGANGLRIVDTDCRESLQYVSQKLFDMGVYEGTTMVKTPNRGVHFWLRIPIIPAGLKTFYKLNPEVGDGEFRLRRNSYVVAPASTLPEGEYRFIQGGYEAFLEQPVLTWEQMLWLLPKDRQLLVDVQADGLVNLPIRPIYHERPALLALMPVLEKAAKGDCIPRLETFSPGKSSDRKVYPTRSEAEYAVIVSLVLNGWSFNQIEDLFYRAEPGHFAEHRNRRKYLVICWNNAVEHVCSDATRQRIAMTYHQIEKQDWLGPENARMALLAVLAKGWMLASIAPRVGVREVSEHGSMSIGAASYALRYLQEKRLIHRTYRPDRRRSKNEAYLGDGYDLEELLHLYKLSEESSSGRESLVNPLSNTPPAVITVHELIHPQTQEEVELWSSAYLGETGKQIWASLVGEPKGVRALARETKRAINTVRGRLDALEQVGLASRQKTGWVRGSGTMAEAAELLGVERTLARRRHGYEQERKKFHRSLIQAVEK